jgi:ferredoxin--NADP+ reductase
MSIIRDPEIYDRFETVVVVHGVRRVSELGYADTIEKELPEDGFIGELVARQLRYYPTVTREPFRNQGRITDLLESGRLCADLGLPGLDSDSDRVMICGSPSMLRDLTGLLESRGFREGSSHGAGQYVVERAFAER